MEICGETFHVRVEGPPQAPVVMLSNSLGTDMTMWDGQASALARTFRVVRYDVRGHGATAVSPGPYSIAGLGRDALAILDALQIAKAHWIGVSMGGMVGQWLLAEASERFERAVLADTAAHYPDSSGWNARIATVRAKGMEPIVSGVVERWFTPEFARTEPKTFSRFADMLRAQKPEGYASCCAAIRDMDLRESNRKIKNPTLVVVGSRDLPTPPELGLGIVERIRGAQVHRIDAAHLSNVERPGEFLRAASDFISGS